MDDRRIEEMLRRSWQPQPPDGMRERILRRSRQELERRRPIWRFALRRPVFAALALAVLLAVNVSDHYRQARISAMTEVGGAKTVPGGLLRQRRDMEKLLVQGFSDRWTTQEGGERL